MRRRKRQDSKAALPAVGWEIGGYYLDVPHPERGGGYYACQYDAGTRSVRRRTLGTTDPDEAKSKLIALVAGAAVTHDAPHPRDVMTLSVLQAYLDGHATTIRSEHQAQRAVDLVTVYLRDHIKQLAAPVSFWTPARQREFAEWLQREHKHAASTIERIFNVVTAAFNDAVAIKMRTDPLGKAIEGSLMSHAPAIVYKRARIAKELKIAPPKVGSGFVPTLDEMAQFIDALKTPHLQRWIILALTTWARPEAITDFDPKTQYDRRSGMIDLNPPGRPQTNKRRPAQPITRTLAGWLDVWGEGPLLVYKRERVGTVKKAVKRIGDEIGLPDFTQYTPRRFMATTVRRMAPNLPREKRSMWMGHAVKEGSRTTDHYEIFEPELLADVALATDYVLQQLHAKLKVGKLLAVDERLNASDLRRIGARPEPKKLSRILEK